MLQLYAVWRLVSSFLAKNFLILVIFYIYAVLLYFIRDSKIIDLIYNLYLATMIYAIGGCLISLVLILLLLLISYSDRELFMKMDSKDDVYLFNKNIYLKLLRWR